MGQASRFLLQHLPVLREAARLGPLVDLACGRGRNTLAVADAGLDCIGFDRQGAFLQELRGAGEAESGRIAVVRCDLEGGGSLPLKTGSCGAILVFRFLFRPLAPAIERALAPGGVLLYETFTRDQPAHGWGPQRPEFLLEPGELPRLFPNLQRLHHDEDPVATPRPEASARLAARRPLD